MKTKTFWRPGEMAAVARAAGIPQSNFSGILHRKRGVSKDKAYFYQQITAYVLGQKRSILATHWLFNDISQHPAFFGKPKRFNPKKFRRGLKSGGRYGSI